MSDWLSHLGPWLRARPDLILPFLLSLGMALCDLKTGRIPNYLTLGGALAGLGFQLGYHGLGGLIDGLAGWGLGLVLLLGAYMLGGMGAGDVKASAALGAWLGLRRALAFFVYMGLAGGLIILVGLLWQRRLLAGIREVWDLLLNWVLCRPADPKPPRSTPRPGTTIP